MARTDLHEIRIAGRGGQGVVTAGELLGKAAIGEGRFAQSIPTFGPERRGALSQAMLRIASGQDEILLKCTTARPSVLLVLDTTIWHFANTTLGLQDGATLVFNTPKTPDEVDAALRDGRHGYRPVASGYRLFTVDATAKALAALGRPITNTAMMGAFVGATGLLRMESVEAVLMQRFGELGPANVAAACAARRDLRQLGA